MVSCSVDGCDKLHLARGYCSKHLQRWCKYGSTTDSIRFVRQTCSVLDCDRLRHAHGLCRKHYRRKLATGSTDDPKPIDRIGQRFGKLIVIARAPPRKGQTWWLCKCDCGREKHVANACLVSGGTVSCRECKKIQLNKGDRFGRLLVIREATSLEKQQQGKKSTGRYYWVRCDCDGNEKIVPASALKNGSTRSCGCLHNETSQKNSRMCNWYNLQCANGVTVTLQGMFELRLAILMDVKEVIFEPHPLPGIPWVDVNGGKHTYYPDFFVPERNAYVDPKNRRVAIWTADKIRQVKEQNPHLKIVILDHDILQEMGLVGRMWVYDSARSFEKISEASQIPHLTRGKKLGPRHLSAEERWEWGSRCRTHGQCQAAEYRSWAGMRARCLCPTNQNYEEQGRRGIKIDFRWDSFENFLQDMGKRPGPGFQLSRDDPNSDYGPGLCQWIPHSTNKRIYEIKVTYRGVEMTLKEAVVAGRDVVTLKVARERFKAGWSVEKAVETTKGGINLRASNTSGHTGVSFDKKRGEWRVYIRVNWKRIHLGFFTHKEDAFAARQDAELCIKEGRSLKRERSNNTSGHIGVLFHKSSGKWEARITVNRKRLHLGLFTFKSDAIAARQLVVGDSVESRTMIPCG
jgi:hypothetical protein